MENTLLPAQKKILDEVLLGLCKEQKTLPSKFFYDHRGSELFEEITHLDEYYLTRTEIEILEDNIEEIVETIGPKTVIIELGSGSSKKTRFLLDHLQDVAAYIPVDISDEYLMKVAESLNREYPDIPIKPLCADYTRAFDLPALQVDYNRVLAYYPGSTIGNFRMHKAKSFLKQIAGITGHNGSMLIGVDLKKDPEILESAYNDSKGITAAFNKNILHHLNNRLDTTFDPDLFEHEAIFNEEEGRIEMHLRCKEDHVVTVDEEKIYFESGETIHTEDSYKYSLEQFEDLVSEWFDVEKVWTDDKNLFSLQFLRTNTT